MGFQISFLSIGQGTFLSNPSHRPDHIEVMDGTMDDWPGDLPGQDYQQTRKNIVPVLGMSRPGGSYVLVHKLIEGFWEPFGPGHEDYGKEESHNSFEHNWWQEAKGRGDVKMKDFLHEFNEGFLKVIPRFLEELMVENSWRTGLTFTGQDVSKEGRGL